MSKWAEIRTDYINEMDDFLRVDAWKTDDDGEEGKVIAYIDTLSGRVLYVDPAAITDEYAQEEIKEASERYKKEHPYSVEELEYFCKSVVEHSLDSSSVEDARENLLSFGFEDGDMRFFGFPEYVDEDAGDDEANSIQDPEEIGRLLGGIVPSQQTDFNMIDIPGKNRCIAFADVDFYEANVFYGYDEEFGEIDPTSIFTLSEICKDAAKNGGRAELSRISFDNIVTYDDYAIIRVRSQDGWRYYAIDNENSNITEVEPTVLHISSSPSVRDMRPIDFGGEYDGMTDDFQFCVSFNTKK